MSTRTSSKDDIKAWQLEHELRCLRFVLRLPLVASDETKPHGTECTICNESYDKGFQIRGQETACQLPCYCLVGHFCLWERFAPFKGAYTTCPICNVQFPELVNEYGDLSRPSTDALVQRNVAGEAISELEQLRNDT